MDAARYQRLSDLFAEACDLDAADRAAFLTQVRGDDPVLADELAELLGHDVTATVALDRGPGLSERPAPPLPPRTRLGACELVRFVGGGGAGQVHEARVVSVSEQLGAHTRVAVKVLHPGRVRRPESLDAFRREARLGSRVVHPNVARTLDAGTAVVDGRTYHYLVMEFVEGTTLADYLDEHGALPETLVRHVGAAIARGLSALHAVGIVHRDIKPANVVITPDDVVKLTDLGIALDPDSLRSDLNEGRFVGTLAYAAPEQLGGTGNVGPATDLYALGIVLRELLSGERAFAREGGEGAVQAILAGAEATRRLEVPRVGHALLELTSDLASTRPDDRPQHAAEVAEILAGRASRTDGGTASPWTCLGADPEHPLRGRSTELNLLRSVLAEVAEGQGAVVVVRGPTGSGRTRLLRQALVDSRRAGIDSELVVTTADAREPLVQVLHGAPAVSQDRDLAVARTRRAILERCTERPVVVAFDDIGRANPAERRLVTALARDVDSSALVVVVTVAAGQAEGVVASLLTGDRARCIDLAELDSEARHRLLTDRLQDATLAGRVLPVLERFGADTPAELVAGLRHLHDIGALVRLPDGRWAPGAELEQARPPESLRRAASRWFLDLRGPDRELVLPIACAGGALPLVAAARLQDSTELGLLERVERSVPLRGRLRVKGAELRLEPARASEIVAACAAPAERTELHRRIARALADLDDERHLGEIALHAARGGDEELLLASVDRGLRRLREAGRHADVVEVAERAAESEGVPAERIIDLLNQAESADTLAGRNDRRVTRMERVRELAAGLDDPEQRFLPHIQLCIAATDQGDYEATEQLARRALAMADAPGHRKAEAWRHLGLALVALGRLPEAADAYRAGIELSDRTDTAWDHAAQRLHLAELFIRMRRLDEAAELVDEARPMVGAIEAVMPTLTLRLTEGLLASRTGRLDEAEVALSRASELARGIGDRQREAIVLMHRAGVLHRRMDLAGARRALTTAVSLFREFGSSATLGLAQLGDLARAEGRWEDAEARLAEAVREARAEGNRFSELAALGFLTATAIDRGRRTAALAAAMRQRDHAETIGDPVRMAIADIAVGVAELALGRVEIACGRLSGAAQVLARTPSPHRVTAALALAAIAESRDDLDELERQLTEARMVAERSNLDAARTAVAAFVAPLELRRGRLDEAREVARTLRALARGAGLPGPEVEALALLARTSGPPVDPALVAEVVRLLDEQGSRLPLRSRVVAVAHLLEVDVRGHRARAIELLREIRSNDPDLDVTTVDRLDPALATVLRVAER